MNGNIAFIATLSILMLFASCSKKTPGTAMPPPHDTIPSSPGGTDTSIHVSSGKWFVDSSFHSVDTFISCAAIQPDGKIILATHTTIKRVDKNGIADNSFMTATVTGGEIYCLALQADGKILIGGSFSQVSGVNSQAVARLNNDGALDKSFSSNIYSGGSVSAIELQTTGKIIIGGNFYWNNGGGVSDWAHLVRLFITGAIDTSFAMLFPVGSLAASKGRVSGITIRSDNTLYICGTQIGSYITRTTTDGVSDGQYLPNWTANSTLYYNYSAIFTAKDLSDGRVLVGGNFDQVNISNSNTFPNNYYYGPVVLTDSKGLIDRSFTFFLTGGFIKRIVLMDDNNFFIGGGNPACLLVKNDGTVDSSYNLAYPRGLGTDLIKETTSSILVTGKLIFNSDIPQSTVGIVRIIKKS